jgi:pilus assembly protein CpaC
MAAGVVCKDAMAAVPVGAPESAPLVAASGSSAAHASAVNAGAPAMTAASTAQQTMPGGGPGGNQVLHIMVGHSVVVRTAARLKRVLVGNAAVVTTATTAPNEVVITAAGAGSSSVVLWQENNESKILEVFADVDVSLLRQAVAQSFPSEPVGVEAEEGKIVLTGKASAQTVADHIVKMAAPFSKEIVNSMQVALPTRQKQILLKVRFAEVDRSKLTQFGINLFSTGGANTFGAVSTQQFGGVSGSNVGSVPRTVTTGTIPGSNIAQGSIGAPLSGQPGAFATNDLLNLFLFRTDINLGAIIRDLQQRNVVQILAEPNLLAADGEPADFLAGGELPYPVVTGIAGQSTVSVQFKPFGIKLGFTGNIESDNTIRLKVYPEVSALDFSNAVTISGFVEPAITTRNAHTVVELRDGQSFGIAGLLDQRTTAQFSKLPGIADIPILGRFFQSRSVNRTNSELLVIVTPSIVDPAAASGPGPELPKMPIAPLDEKQFDTQVPSQKGS